MSDAGLLIPLTPADVALFASWDAAVEASIHARPIGLEEMVVRLFGVAHRLAASSRAANLAYGSPFDDSVVRDHIAVQKAARFFEAHPAEVAAILRPQAAAKRRRA